MALVIPRNQELPMSWTAVDAPPPPPTFSELMNAKDTPSTTTAAMKRITTTTTTNDTKKRRRKEDKSSVLKKDGNAAATAAQLSMDCGSDNSSQAQQDHDEDAENKSANGDYYGVDDPKWPAFARKRMRMSDEERKARHREVQRQFMQRKLSKLEDMRKLMEVLEKQYLLLQLSQDRARLEHEHEYLSHQVATAPSFWSHDERPRVVHLPPARLYALPLRPTVVAHPQIHHHHQTHRPHTGMLPWDEILEAVSEAKESEYKEFRFV